MTTHNTYDNLNRLTGRQSALTSAGGGSVLNLAYPFLDAASDSKTGLKQMTKRTRLFVDPYSKILNRTIVYLFFGWELLAFGSSGDAIRPSHEILQGHKSEVARACDMAMTNIQSKLQVLAKHFPPLERFKK